VARRPKGAGRGQAHRLTLIHTADVHLDSTFAQATLASDLGQSLRAATREAFKRVLALAESENADALLIAGDLYDHEYVTPDTGAFLLDAFAALGERPVIIAPGNHDPYVSDSLYARLDWPANVHLFTSQTPTAVTIDRLNLCVHGFAHREFDCRDRLFTRFEAPKKDGLVHVALAHGSDVSRVPPGKEAYGPFEPADLAAVAGIRYWALGHYHAHGPVEAGDGVTAHYAGCVQGRHFGETGPRHALVVTITAKRVRAKPVPVSVRTFETAEIDVGGFAHSDALVEHIRGLCDAPAWGEAIARLTLVGEAPPTLEIDSRHLREVLAERFAHVTFIDRTRPALDPAAVAEEQTARGEFVRRLLNRIEQADDEQDQDALRLALRVGLAAYDGRQVPIE